MPREKKTKEDSSEVSTEETSKLNSHGVPVGTETAPVEPPTPVPPTPNPEGQKITFKVKNPNSPSGVSERVFSKEEHGSDYKALADEFAATNASSIVTE